MANSEHLDILTKGVEVWNNWRDKNPDVRPDLQETDLCEARIVNYVNLSERDRISALFNAVHWKADLRGANLSKAYLMLTKFLGAYLNEVDFRGAHLGDANLCEADLSKANFSEADLRGAKLNYAKVDGANFKKAKMERTILPSVNLSTAKNLDTVIHTGPCSIGIDTLSISKGQIPEPFLRGCGLSDWQIEFSKLHRENLSIDQIIDIQNRILELRSEGAFVYHRCFMSYSHADEKFAQKLHNDLQNSGVRCWYAPKDMKTGEKIRQRIDHEISNHEKLLIILSENSIESTWVENEVEAAFADETASNAVLIPIRIDDAVMNTDRAWAKTIKRTRQIGDFSEWAEQNAYQNYFSKLLKDLRVD